MWTRRMASTWATTLVLLALLGTACVTVGCTTCTVRSSGGSPGSASLTVEAFDTARDSDAGRTTLRPVVSNLYRNVAGERELVTSATEPSWSVSDLALGRYLLCITVPSGEDKEKTIRKHLEIETRSGVRVRVVLENRRAGWTRSLVAVGAVAATIIIVGEWVEDQMSGGFLKN
jgi:hypothetical protein